ncbi:MAG: ABC transporter permease, partial [Chloroflexi bacterium]|nr:ABC transporter permease [Chloroflexota bacterium]
PAIAIILLVMAFNFVGDGVRDAFDPRLRNIR